MSLITFLQQVPEFRRGQGQRYPLTGVLLLVIMSIICGHYGYREIASFCKAHEKELVKWLALKHGKVPSHVTFRTVLMNISFEDLIKEFQKWASQYVNITSKDWVAIDGKSLGSTVEKVHDSYQNFVSLVSVFSHRRKQVLGIKKYENKKTSEISVVQDLIEELDLTGVVITLDSLHCQKKQRRSSLKVEMIT